jgi:HemY protein
LLLSAQAAQLNGDEAAAHKYFTAMLNRPETEFLGLRGLLNHALREGDTTTALRLVERAHGLRPKSQWVLTSLFELQTRRGLWEEARVTLTEAVKRSAINSTTARHYQGALLFAESQAAQRQGDTHSALALADRAHGFVPELASVAVHRARLLAGAGSVKQANKILEAAWRDAPQPLVAEAYCEITPTESPLGRLRRLERLVKWNPEHIESLVALARASLDAKIWPEARRQLELAGAAPFTAGGTGGTGATLPQARVCRMMAELELAQHGDGLEVRHWLALAAEASPDPVYVCGKCDAESRQWQPLCPRCQAFDTLTWKIPDRAAPVMISTAPAPAAITARSSHAVPVPAAATVDAAPA